MNNIVLPTGDWKIDSLLVDLTTLVKEHGKESFQVDQFLEQHQDVTWVDRVSGETHYFSEIGGILASLIQGISIEDVVEDEENSDPADWWKN